MTELQRLQRIIASIEALQAEEDRKKNDDALDAFEQTVARAKSDAYTRALILLDAEINKAEQETR